MKKANSTTESASSIARSEDSRFPSKSAEIKSYLLFSETLTALDGLQLFRCRRCQGVFDLLLKGLAVIVKVIESDSSKRIAHYFLNTPVQ